MGAVACACLLGLSLTPSSASQALTSAAAPAVATATATAPAVAATPATSPATAAAPATAPVAATGNGLETDTKVAEQVPAKSDQVPAANSTVSADGASTGQTTEKAMSSDATSVAVVEAVEEAAAVATDPAPDLTPPAAAAAQVAPETQTASAAKTAQLSKPVPVMSRLLKAMSDEFNSPQRNINFVDGSTFGNWTTVFAGYGTVTYTGSALYLAPQTVSSPELTSAALVVSQQATAATCINVESRFTTEAQLRTGSSPNPWETAWLVWDYVDNDHFTYLAVKPNGWEIGRRDPSYPGGQRFIATGESVLTPIGQARTAKIQRNGTTSTLALDGLTVVSFEMPNAAERRGKVGMYTEDAAVTFDYLRTSTC